MKQMKVLLIEDDQDDIEIYVDLFKIIKPSVDYMVAHDGEAGLKILEGGNWVPDQIILDYVLPKMTALEFISGVRSNPSYRLIPITVISAVCHPEKDNDLQPLGIPCFTKPTSVDVFRELLESVLSSEWLAAMRNMSRAAK